MPEHHAYVYCGWCVQGSEKIAINNLFLYGPVNAAHISVYNGAADDNDINGGICVVCMDKPQSAGFLHGDR